MDPNRTQWIPIEPNIGQFKQVQLIQVMSGEQEGILKKN
jgi:hypothetical protein